MENSKVEFLLAKTLLSRAIINQTFSKMSAIKSLLSDIATTRRDIADSQVKKRDLENWILCVTHLQKMLRTLTALKVLLKSNEMNSSASPQDAGSPLLSRLQYLNSDIVEPTVNRLSLNHISLSCPAVDQTTLSAIEQFSAMCQSGLPVCREMVKTAEAMVTQLDGKMAHAVTLNDCLLSAMDALSVRASLYFGRMHQTYLKHYEDFVR